MPSYEKINYLLRPNKSVERKMVCELLSRLSAIKDISTYQYIGMGSTYFADFSLFHRALGISHMISIEGEGRAQDRCEFNKPYSCIDLKMGITTEILPNLDFNSCDSIVWLDYDDGISDTVFSDINTLVTMLRPDSFFMLSLNAEYAFLKQKSEDGEDGIRSNLIQRIGENRFPNEFREKAISAKEYLKILYMCVVQEINSAVQKRNGMEENKVMFHQTINFVYKDGARMITIGGFLLNVDEEEEKLMKMGIKQLPFYRNTLDYFHIKCPILSIKEIQALNKYLPCEIIMDQNGKIGNKKLDEFPVENRDIKQYSYIYRYYPNFAETLL